MDVRVRRSRAHRTYELVEFAGINALAGWSQNVSWTDRACHGPTLGRARARGRISAEKRRDTASRRARAEMDVRRERDTGAVRRSPAFDAFVRQFVFEGHPQRVGDESRPERAPRAGRNRQRRLLEAGQTGPETISSPIVVVRGDGERGYGDECRRQSDADQ